MTIDRPILIVGCGRSGTTLLYQILCGHPDLAWFSTYTSRWPNLPQLAALSRAYPILRGRRIAPRGLPLPSEGYPIWDLLRPPELRQTQQPLTEDDVAMGEQDRIRIAISRHLRYQGGRRFINKNTRNIRRLRYLNALLPEALFVHITRDPRATAASLLKVPWWRDLPVWCFGGMTPRQWVSAGNPEEAMAAEVWRQELEIALAHKQFIPTSRYLQLRYEDLTADPEATLRQVLDFIALDWSPRFEQFFQSFDVRDSNVKFGTQLTKAQIRVIERITRPLAASLGYEVPSSD